MPEDGSRTLYCIVLTDQRAVQDMLSHQDLGKIPGETDPDTLRLFSGISLYNTEQQARRTARGLPWHGNAFIAELKIPLDAPVEIEKTTTSRGHHTLWGDPHVMLGYVSSVRHV